MSPPEVSVATPRTAHLVGWTAVAGSGGRQAMTEKVSRVLDAFVGDYGRLRVMNAREDFAFGFWKPEKPLPLTTWSSHSDRRFACFVEGVFYDDYESHRIVEGEDPGLALELVETIRAEGERAIGRLNGSFAGFVFDAESGELSTFVDRLGTKVVYWTRLPGDTVVSTNLAAFRGIAPIALDLTGAFQFLTIGFPIGERTLLDRVSVQAPGSVHYFSAGSEKASRYWTPPAREEGLSLRGAVARITEAMEDCVTRLARRSSSPFGLGLTGGHDSRVILSSLLHQKIPFEAVSWWEDNFNDRVVSQLCARARKTPHFVSEACRRDIREIQLNAFTYTDGQYRHAYGFTWLGRECSVEGLDLLMVGFGGDMLSGSAPISWYGRATTVRQLARTALSAQMELLSFRDTEAVLTGGAFGHRAETQSSWMESFEREAWRSSLLDTSIWQRLQNRNFKRIRPVMNPALQYVQVLYPYLDNAVLAAYFSLPARLLNQRPHCYAGFSRFRELGDLPATAFPISLRREAAFPLSVHLARLGKANLQAIRSRFHRAPARRCWSADDELAYLEVAESPLFDSRRLDDRVARGCIKIAALRRLRTLVTFERFYVRGNVDLPRPTSQDGPGDGPAAPSLLGAESLVRPAGGTPGRTRRR